MLAKELGVARETVKRSEHFAKGLDAAEAVSPGIRDAVLSGEVKAPKSNKHAISPVEAPTSNASALAVFLYSQRSKRRSGHLWGL